MILYFIVGLIILLLTPVWLIFGVIIFAGYLFCAVGEMFMKMIKDDDSDDYY